MVITPSSSALLCPFQWTILYGTFKARRSSPVYNRTSPRSLYPFAKSTYLPIPITVTLQLIVQFINCIMFWMYYLGVIFFENYSFLPLIIEIWEHFQTSFWISSIHHYNACKTALARLGWLNSRLGSLVVNPSEFNILP